MIRYVNLDINSSGKSSGSGIITAMQIKMNNISNAREAVVGAKEIYYSINEKIAKSKEKVMIK